MKEQNTQKPPFKLVLLSWIPTLIALVVIIAIMIPVLLLVTPMGSLLFIVDGSSMDTTLHHGQYMFQAGTDFARGDIVTCTVPDSQDSTKDMIIIKRIVGMPGDTVRIDQSGVYINGEKLEEDYLTAGAIAGTYRETLRNHAELGPTEYFLMGDNRQVSYDSRFFGAVDRSDLLYKASVKPSRPFFLAAGKVLLIFVAAIVLNFLLEDLLTKLFCKKNPELAVYIAEEAKKKQRKQTKPEEPQDTQ